MATERQKWAEAKAAHNHPVYAVMSYVMGCGVQGAGSGSRVTDGQGRDFLALFDQYGNQSFGYSHPRFVAALRDQLDTGRLNSTKIMFETEQIRLAERLSALTDGRLPFSYLANSGGETIDNALKLARAATGRHRVVSAVDCFHGKTFGALSASGRPEHEAMFAPLLDGFEQVPFNDLDALRAAVDGGTAAVLLEPVQAEGGVIVPHPGYLQEVRRLCTEAGALLVLDEMQTAFGRCGTFFAFERFGVLPDLVCIGKAFGGGMLPISAVLGTPEVWHALRAMPSTFGSSLGGNPLSCRIGSEAVATASEAGFLARVRATSALLETRLGALARRFPGLIGAHRGVGMMWGLEFHDESLGGLVLRLLYERGVTSTYSLYNPKVLRIQPPMVISPDELTEGLTALEEALEEVEAWHARPEPPGFLPPLRMTFPLDRPAAHVRRILAELPRALDPFAADNHAGPEQPDPFEGTLGDDPVRWADRVTVTAGGVSASAGESWLWQRLDRTATVHADGSGPGCTVEVTLDWDCGTGPYEALLAGRLTYFATRRTAALVDRLAALTAP